MAHTISRLAREEHRLVDIRGDSAPSKVSRESTVTHEHDVIRVGDLFPTWSTLRDMTAIVMNADDRTLVQRSKNYFFITLRHRCYRTSIRHQSVKSVADILAKQNRGLLLDIFVFVLNIFLMQRLTRAFIDLFALASAGQPRAQLALLFVCVAMYGLPVAGAILLRWHFHQRLKEEGKSIDEAPLGCLFSPIFYFCLNIVIMSAIVAGFGQMFFGDRLMADGGIFLPLIFGGLILTILQTVLIYRYFSVPQKPPRFEFLRRPESEMLGDVCIFANMILFQVAWNLLTFGSMRRPSGPGEFIGRLFILCFIALLIYFPPRMFYLAEDINRGRTWLFMLLANSPVIVRLLIGTKQWQ